MHYVLGYRIPLVSPSLNQLYFCICCQVACFICLPPIPLPSSSLSRLCPSLPSSPSPSLTLSRCTDASGHQDDWAEWGRHTHKGVPVSGEDQTPSRHQHVRPQHWQSAHAGETSKVERAYKEEYKRDAEMEIVYCSLVFVKSDHDVISSDYNHLSN